MTGSWGVMSEGDLLDGRPAQCRSALGIRQRQPLESPLLRIFPPPFSHSPAFPSGLPNINMPTVARSPNDRIGPCAVKMDPAVFTLTEAPAVLLDLLSAHLPFSLPLLRRLQFTRLKGGLTPSSRILFASETNQPPHGEDVDRSMHFTAAYIDPAAGPETQMWIYSTLEDGGLSADDAETATRLVASVVNQAKIIGREYEGELAYPGGILLGTLHVSVRQAMDAAGIDFKLRSAYGYDKWLFRIEELPPGELGLPDGMDWSTATREDCEVAISRNDLPRQAYG